MEWADLLRHRLPGNLPTNAQIWAGADIWPLCLYYSECGGAECLDETLTGGDHIFISSHLFTLLTTVIIPGKFTVDVNGSNMQKGLRLERHILGSH